MHAVYMGLAVAAICFIACGDVAAAETSSVFEPGVRLQSEGRDIDTGEAWGHSGPALADIDADGKRELVVGDFSGRFRVFPNVGTEESPKFGPQTYLMAGGEEAKVPIYCCIGSSPYFVDYDGDGVVDLLSGSYDPGECYLFRGLGKGQFAARETLVGADGKPVLRVPDQQQEYQSFGSWPVMVDWDADGDLDLLVGGFDGTMFVRLNEGTRQNPALSATNLPVMAGDEELKVSDKHAAPALTDWDGDGRWDILSGSELGAVVWFRNVGTAEAPAFEREQVLLPKQYDENASDVMEANAEPKPGVRTQICATDYNGDGKTDLLVGDFQTTKSLRTDLTKEQRDEASRIDSELQATYKASRESLAALQKSFHEKYPGDAALSSTADAQWTATYQAYRASEARKAIDAKVEELSKALHAYLAQPETAGKFDDYETTHGYVWLYVRK